MKVLSVKVNKHPEIIEINNTLENLQKQVHGLIECVYPFNEPVAIVCNEEGKINGVSEFNRALVDDDSNVYDYIFDDFLIVYLFDEDGEEDGNFHSLPDDLAKKFYNLFYHPHKLINIDGYYAVISMEDE